MTKKNRVALKFVIVFYLMVLLVSPVPYIAGSGGELTFSPGVNSPSSMKFDIKKYNGKKLVLFFYSLNEQHLNEAVDMIKYFYKIRNEYNFNVAGLSLNPDLEQEVMSFNQDNNISFPVFFDHNHEFASRHKVKGKTGFFIYNKKGKRIGGALTSRSLNISHAWRAIASRYLKIGYIPEDAPVLGIKPPVPVFEGKALNGETIKIKEIFKKKPVIITIFSPKCKNCRNELGFLNSLYSSGDLKGKFEIVALSILNEKVTSQFVKEKKYLFPVIVSNGKKIASLFPSYTGPVPTSFVVDRDGRINAIHTGFNPYLKDIYVMELKKLAGLPNPPLLFNVGYSGEQRCGICHEKEHIQWSLTRHSDAFKSLVRKGKEDDLKCVPCHVTGFGRKGGYSLKISNKRARYLKGIQCEACHGAGNESCSAFNKDKPVKKTAEDWENFCRHCHTQKQSLNFVFAKRFPKVVHSNAPDLSAMNREERLKFVRKYREKQNVFDNTARYVGAEACKECHRQEYDHWKKTAHAGVHKTSRAGSVSPETEFRYNTGVNSAGGYPEPGREGVQCEACHGPGERHINKPEAKGQDYIVSLGSTCSNCVVEQICRRCHSPSDDPDFDFDRQIEKVRHNIKLHSGEDRAKEVSIDKKP